MSVLRAVIEALVTIFGFRGSVSTHTKHQAYGRRWSKHRPRRIGNYTRRRRGRKQVSSRWEVKRDQRY